MGAAALPRNVPLPACPHKRGTDTVDLGRSGACARHCAPWVWLRGGCAGLNMLSLQEAWQIRKLEPWLRRTLCVLTWPIMTVDSLKQPCSVVVSASSASAQHFKSATLGVDP